jgi:hypothetical protein
MPAIPAKPTLDPSAALKEHPRMLRLAANSNVVLLLLVLAGGGGCAGQMTTTKWRRIDVPRFFSFRAPPQFPDAATRSRGGMDWEPERRAIYEAERGGIGLTLAHGWGKCGTLPSGWRSQNIRISGYPALLAFGPPPAARDPGPWRYRVYLCLSVPARLGETSTILFGDALCKTLEDRRIAEAILRSVTLDPNSIDMELLRSPTAYYTTGGWGDLLARLESFCARGRQIWRAPWSYEDETELRWTGEPPPQLRRGLLFHRWSLADAAPNWGSSAEDCSLTVWRRFYAHRETLGFTMGRSPESCSEAPRILWADPGGRHHRSIIPPLFNWNLDGLWRTEHYLVLGLVAPFEGGEEDERLAFWNLENGQIVLSPGEGLGDSARVVRREGAIRVRLPGWRNAVIAEDGDALVVAKHDTSITFWPNRRAYSVVSGAAR